MLTLRLILFLAVLQGVTEFIPVSSSGHLAIAQLLLPSFKEPAVVFDLFLHLGTLLATILYFWKELSRLIYFFFSHLSRPKEIVLISYDSNNYIPQIIITTLITGAIAFPLKNIAEKAFYNLHYIIVAYFVTAFLLFITQFRRTSVKDIITYKDAILIGLIQGMAIFPGLSRSGSTIAMALILGIERKKTFTYSFLISLPVIGGAFIIECLPMVTVISHYLTQYLLGSFISLLTGYVSLMFLSRIINTSKVHYFAYYCAALALSILVYVLL